MRRLMMGLGALAVALGAGAAGGSAAASATAPACPAPLAAAQTVSPPGGVPFVVCSGRVPSFDGTPLDVDVSIPATARGPLPLMVMMHGWGNSKTEWEATTLEGDNADKWHWNNAWFAAHGYTVLTYSARGFHGSCGKDQASGYIYTQDGSCTGHASWTHLADRRWEVHDTQYLAGLLVDAGVARPQVVATGGSYGGGQSWDLALSQDRVVDAGSSDPSAPILHPWVSPRGVSLHLVAAVPRYPWTDLAQALQQNGLASDGFHGAPATGSDSVPPGVLKQSYVAGLFALGETTAQYSAPGVDPTADLSSWFAVDNAGEPYESNPEAAQALTQIASQFRSPIAMPVPPRSREVPVLVFQGNTDPLFPAIQATQQINRLLAADAHYPVWGFFGDLGHSYAQNPHALWQQGNTLANDWLTAVLARRTPSTPAITTVTTSCSSAQTPRTFTASSYDRLATSVVRLTDSSTQQTVSAPGIAPEGGQSDPIANSGCRTVGSGSDPGVATYTFPIHSDTTLIGAPIVRADVTVNGVNAELAARLWDVDPAGTQTLVSRTVVRLEAAAPGATRALAFELGANSWEVLPGHSLRLELTQNDSPTWRPDNEPSSLSISGLRLDLPAVVAPGTDVPEAPAPGLLLLLPGLAAAAAAGRRRRR
jgi:dienelactone hydrolase